MPYHRLTKKPPNAKLAKNVPEKGMHGYLPTLPKELAYWEGRAELAVDYAETAVEDLALALVHDIGSLVNLTPFWKQYGAIDRGFNRRHPHWQSWDNGRRDRLGVIALSVLCRDLFSPENFLQLMDHHALTEEERMDYTYTLPEPSARNDQKNVVDARIHMSGDDLDVILEDTYDPETEGPAVWYKGDGPDGLYLRRKAIGDPTTSYKLQLMELGVQADFDGLQTVFPYLPAR